NMRILEYESWLVEHLVRVDSVPTHEKDVLILSVESLKADILHELERLQDLKHSPFSVPVRCYHYHDLKEWIGEFICRPGIEDLIDRDVYSNPVDNDGKMRDVWDGEVLRAFKGPDGKPFISKNGDEGRYIFSLAMDGFNPRRSKAAGKRVSSVGVYMVCLNLPLEHRYLVENMFLVGVIP
ncbi:hypothetical protein BKA93DRAFT_705835, partial [Sparassis latifolia]